MKRLWILLALLVVLCGCAKPQAPGGSDVPPDPPIDTTPTLLETAVPVGTAGNLWHIDKIDLGRMDHPHLMMVGENLLIIEYLYRENGSARMFLKLTDLKTGALIREIDFDCGGYVRVQVQGDRVGLCDSGDGWVKFFDFSLQELEHHDLDGDWGDWVLSPDMRSVYELHWERGINRVDLTSKTRTPVMEAREPALMHLGNGELTMSYLDMSTQRFAYGVLNLQTGVIEPIRLPVNISWVARHGDQYLVTDGGQWELRHLISGKQHLTTMFFGNQMEILPEKGHLYTHDMENRNPALYTMEGKLISALQLPGGEWVQMGGKMAWCESWGGYFLATARDGDKPRLLFWDPKVAVTGEDLPTEPYKEEESKPQTAEQIVYQRVQWLSEKYGLDIRIAEQCALEYDEFIGAMVTDTQVLTTALDLLEQSLASYPENFFRQLPFGRMDSIRIELIGGLRRKDWPEDAAFTSFAAFTQDKGDHYLMVVDVHSSYVGTYYHEFSHIIDRKMEWDSIYREGALYSEDGWLELQPEGFSYSYNYQMLPENWSQYLNWFVDDYAMTMPTEDRARVLEYAMNGWEWSFVDRPNLLPKLAYYCRCIRDCFDTTGWPEQTVWERALERAQAQLAPAA